MRGRSTTKPADVTRTNKYTDRDHAGLAAGTAQPEEHLPRYFAKTGHVDADPKKIKKEGAGRGNWGTLEEIVQDTGYSTVNARRHSNNSNPTQISDFKTKFETIEADPVFEEELHGAGADDDESVDKDTSESSSGSVQEEDHRA